MKKLILIVLVLVAVGVGAGVYTMRRNTVEPTVTTQPLSRGDVVDTVGATGTLEAVETVGEHDLSSRATTTMALGLVRAAQGRDDEAEALLLEALEIIESSGFLALESWVLSRLEQFLRERGRDDEAAVYRTRLAELAPVEGLAAAFSSRIERIA